MSSSFQLAPCGMLRMAMWPRSVFDAFGDSQLAQLAAETMHKSSDSEAYRARYQKILTNERSALHSRTLCDERFLKALTVSNPDFAQRIQRHTERLNLHRPRNKWMRHLEYSLYRYLARAVGRPVPCSLWSGVNLALFGKHDQIMAEDPRYLFTPDLRPFQAILRALGATETYRRKVAWCVNPTLACNEDGSWTLWARKAKAPGDIRWPVEYHLKGSALIDRAIGAIEPITPAAYSDLVKAVVGSAGILHKEAHLMLEQFIDAQVLVGGLDLPSFFSNPEDALREAGRYLLSSHRRHWELAVAALIELCNRLSSTYDDLTLQEVTEAENQVRNVLIQLIEALGTNDVALPQLLLRVDLKAPFRMEMGPGTRERVERGLRLYLRHRQALGMGPAFRQAWWQQLRERLGGGQIINAVNLFRQHPFPGNEPITWQALSEYVGADRQIEDRIRQWEALLGNNAVLVTVNAEGMGRECPLGCLIAGLPGFASREPGALAIGGLLDEPIPIYSRFADLLNPGSSLPDDPLFHWFDKTLQELSSNAGIRIYEYAGSADWNPNSLVRPPFNVERIAPFSTVNRSVDIRKWCLKFDKQRNVPLVVIHPQTEDAASVERVYAAIFSFCSASVHISDPLAELLLTSSFRDRPVPFQAATIPFKKELNRNTTSPKIQLADGSVIRSRRTYINGDELEELISATSAKQFQIWAAFAKTHRLSDMVAVRLDDRPSLLMKRDSPLGLEAVLKGAGRQTSVIMVEDLDMNSFVDFPNGESYALDIAFPIKFENHHWSCGDK
ncbi:MAG: lantibiotic dehydratase [Deltaproteobacteria bacterium]